MLTMNTGLATLVERLLPIVLKRVHKLVNVKILKKQFYSKHKKKSCCYVVFSFEFLLLSQVFLNKFYIFIV